MEEKEIEEIKEYLKRIDRRQDVMFFIGLILFIILLVAINWQ